MEGNNRFQRTFLIFENEDVGYDAGRKPSGYIRTEAGEGRGKLWISVQNLREQGARPVYEAYLMNAAAGRFCIVRAGQLAANKNGHTLEWSFDPQDMGGSGLNAAQFDTAVILEGPGDRPDQRILCPLAAYKKGKTNWRLKAAESLFGRPAEAAKRGMIREKETKQAAEPAKEVKKAIEPVKDTEWFEIPKIESKYVPEETRPEFNISDSSSKRFYEENIPEQRADTAADMTEPADEAGGSREAQERSHLWQDEQQKEASEYLTPDEPAAESDRTNSPVPSDRQQEKPLHTNINPGCMYMNGNMCGMYLQNNGAGPCTGCNFHGGKAGQGRKEAPLGDIVKLEQLLDTSFERSDPFNSKRSDYRWWKVANPVNLNNMLYESGIRSPLLFNPSVMMAHYKYRHLIIGIFTDRQRKKSYLVCGVPGMNMVDRKPFSDMCRWVQMDGDRPVYGAFGYWLVYIDPLTGKFLNIR